MLRSGLLLLALAPHTGAQDSVCADITGDGLVGVADLLSLLAAFGTSADGDVNSSGATDVADLLVLLSQFGTPCTGGSNACGNPPPLVVADADSSGGCGPVLITDPDVNTQEACDRDAYALGPDFANFPGGTPDYLIQTAHDPNDHTWSATPVTNFATITCPSGFVCDVHALVPIGDGNAGQECSSVADTSCDHSMGADESPNNVDPLGGWRDTGERYLEDENTMHDGSQGILREIWVKEGITGQYTLRHPVTHGWGYMFTVNVRCASQAPPPPMVFYFGSTMPAGAPDGAILDDGTGFATGRDGGLSYGWDCDGDENVDWSGGRRGLDRDGGLGINHFDRNGQCGTTADPGNANWQVQVPNGEYDVMVDFGESVVRSDLAGAGLLCSVEGVLACADFAVGDTDCMYQERVSVSDGKFTVTGYSHDSGACHSISYVRLQPVLAPSLTPFGPVTFYFGSTMPHGAGPTAILDDGTGFAEGRDGGYDYGWDCDGNTNVNWSGGRRGLDRDAGLGINHFDRNNQCGTPADPDPANWQIVVPNGDYNVMVDFGESVVRTDLGGPPLQCAVEGILSCSDMAAGDNDCLYQGAVTVSDGKFTVTGYSHDSGACHSISMVRLERINLSPPPPINLEFYYGTVLPGIACTDSACTAVLDDGTGFADGRDAGLSYGWNCDGDNNVDYSGGRRGLDRDGGLGINHFDRAGQCPGPVNWEVKVANGNYNVEVDFGEDHYQHACAIEGVVQCPGGADCSVAIPVSVTDGRFTVTGYSHDTGTCHSISRVKITTADVALVNPPDDMEFYFGTAIPGGAMDGALLDDGTGYANKENDLAYGWNCDGNNDVDYSGGRRGLDRDGGLGLNHFDRNGACPGPVNWEVAIPNGVYTATVDFGEDHYQQACAIEGDVSCAPGVDCVFQGDVTITDGRFTITGYSHDAGTCHSISLVRLSYSGPVPDSTCSGTFSIASDNAYALYINGAYAENVNGGRTNVANCDTATNQFGDPYTGCNWQSVDLHEFSGLSGPLVLGVDALDAGGTGGWIGTAVVNGVTYPTNNRWRCFHGATTAGQNGGWSDVNAGWHGDAPADGWMNPNFDDSAWPYASSLGANGVGPWGDVNREMGAVDDGGLGFITGNSEWIWSVDADAHNDVYCRLTIPCGGEVLFSEDFESADALSRWRGKDEAATPWSATIEDGGANGSAKGLRMNACASGGDAYSVGTFMCSAAAPCLVSYWTKGRIWQGFAEQFAGPHIWTATAQNYEGQMIATPSTSPDDQDWSLIEYVFPSAGIWASSGGETPDVFIHGGGTIGTNPMRFMLESFGGTGACDTTWVDDIKVQRLAGAGR